MPNTKIARSIRHLALLAVVSAAIYSPLSGYAEDARTGIFTLYDPGTERVVNYEDYGILSGIGTYSYKYTITDAPGLARASGEGIDPNTAVEKDPAYVRLRDSGRLRASHWKHMNTDDPLADFFAWATAYKENPGVRLFFTARSLDRLGLYLHALKAYRAAMILYPDAYCWNRELTWTWLIAPAAWDEIVNITRMHPELELKLKNCYVKTEEAIGRDPTKNSVAVTPGQFVRYTADDLKAARADVSSLKVVERRGGKKVACVKYSNGRWGLEVEGKPFFVRGLSYFPVKVGKIYDWNWMYADGNDNEINDVAYESWLDMNGNYRRDGDEPVEGDFKLMQDMGCNTIRILNTLQVNKELLRDMHKTYGIHVLVCDPLGAYTVHSNARWENGTDYTDPDQLKSMRDAALKTAMDIKDEEWLLGYILGNENNLPVDYTGVNASRTQAASQPQEYAKFLNQIAEAIHKIDPDHIVGVGNMGLGLVDSYALYAPDLDFIGVNSYVGSKGFGALWIMAKRLIDRPVLITEFGCDSYATGKGPDEEAQAAYIKNALEDIIYNSAGGPGEGNSIGGILFEWLDEWWKDTRGDPWDSQNTAPTTELAFPDGFSQEEWLGIFGQGRGHQSPFIRVPKKAYYTLKGLWAGR